MMTKKLKVSILLLLLAIVIGCGAYQTYAYLTSTSSHKFEFTIGEITATVEVTGAKTVDSKVVNEDLVYIDYKNDFILNKYGLLDTVASQIKVAIDINNSFPTRVKVMLPKLDELEGIVYIVVDDSVDTIDREIKLQISGGYLQYGYVQDDGTVTYSNLIDISSLSDTSTNSEFRSLINTYNFSKLKSLYEGTDNVYTDEDMYFRVLVWGDYYSLADPTTYLEKEYSLHVEAKVIQAIDKYGGELDYEND